MKITITYPRWHEQHSLIKRIIDDVSGEGGDGWGWVQTCDPYYWSIQVYKHLLSLGVDKNSIRSDNDPRGISISIDQEGWFFTPRECDQPEFYDMIYKIE